MAKKLFKILSSMSIKLIFLSITVGMSHSMTYLWVKISTPTISATNTVLRRRVGSHMLRRTPRYSFYSREPELLLP